MLGGVFVVFCFVVFGVFLYVGLLRNLKVAFIYLFIYIIILIILTGERPEKHGH